MEEKYRAEIEKKRAESVNRAWKIISVFVVVFQLLMLILMAAKPGGPDRKSTRLNSIHSGEYRMPSSA